MKSLKKLTSWFIVITFLTANIALAGPAKPFYELFNSMVGKSADNVPKSLRDAWGGVDNLVLKAQIENIILSTKAFADQGIDLRRAFRSNPEIYELLGKKSSDIGATDFVKLHNALQDEVLRRGFAITQCNCTVRIADEVTVLKVPKPNMKMIIDDLKVPSSRADVSKALGTEISLYNSGKKTAKLKNDKGRTMKVRLRVEGTPRADDEQVLLAYLRLLSTGRNSLKNGKEAQMARKLANFFMEGDEIVVKADQTQMFRFMTAFEDDDLFYKNFDSLLDEMIETKRAKNLDIHGAYKETLENLCKKDKETCKDVDFLLCRGNNSGADRVNCLGMCR